MFQSYEAGEADCRAELARSHARVGPGFRTSDKGRRASQPVRQPVHPNLPEEALLYRAAPADRMPPGRDGRVGPPLAQPRRWPCGAHGRSPGRAPVRASRSEMRKESPLPAQRRIRPRLSLPAMQPRRSLPARQQRIEAPVTWFSESVSKNSSQSGVSAVGGGDDAGAGDVLIGATRCSSRSLQSRQT